MPDPEKEDDLGEFLTELESVADNPTVQHAEIEKTNRILAEFVAKDTGRTLEEVTLSMKSEVYFSATQAKEFGLIDSIGCCRALVDD